MDIVLTPKEIEILDFCLKFISSQDKFYIREIYFRNFIVPKYPGEYEINKDNLLCGNSPMGFKEDADLKTSYININTFLVEKVFANRDDIKNSSGLFITEKGKKLIESGSYQKYLSDSISEQGRLNSLEEEQRRMAQRAIELSAKMTKLTFYVAVGTLGLLVAALIQLLWDVYKFYHPYCQ